MTFMMLYRWQWLGTVGLLMFRMLRLGQVGLTITQTTILIKMLQQHVHIFTHLDGDKFSQRNS